MFTFDHLQEIIFCHLRRNAFNCFFFVKELFKFTLVHINVINLIMQLRDLMLMIFSPE